jgi:N-acetyl-gamma-glutamyl-phosphate/LysW-gamma-L-alpha-aminoadipyl-6-phosphate reductase
MQETGAKKVYLAATAVEMVRGILITAQLILKKDLDEREIRKVYNKYYQDEQFIRIVKERQGIYRYPEPKLLQGTNFCDIGFEKEANTKRLVVMGAIDNLGKGTAGQAVQAMNVMHGWEEDLGLEYPGLHPI